MHSNTEGEFFNFDKAILYNNDRFINENIFIQSLKQLNFCKENEDEIISFIIPMFKNSNKMISLALVKKVISSNLKNFSDEAMNGRPMSDINSSENFSQNNETKFLKANINFIFDILKLFELGFRRKII